MTHPSTHPFPPLDLKASLWVEASAGSGKTKILTDRVLAFLAQGVPPHRLLCLTFTKAAASEMENRILKTLSLWAYAEDAFLVSHLEKLLGRPPTPADIDHSRNLLKTSFDLKIQTFHSFCHSLLEQFPVEAEISPYFSLLDPQDLHSFIENLPSALISCQKSNPLLSNALEDLLPHLSLSSLKDLCTQILDHRDTLETFFSTSGVLISPSTSCPLSFLRQALAEESLPFKALRTFESLLISNSSPSLQEKGLFLKDFLSASFPKRISLYPSYRDIFLTKEKTPRKNILEKSLQTSSPDLLESLKKEQERLLAINDTYTHLHFLSLNQSFYRLASTVLDLYEHFKLSKGALDYTDLLLKTRDLLKDSTKVPWIFYKLDSTLEHILLDEAQDTNALQWEILTLLLTHLKENKEASSSLPKTLFVVGDEKQSIYSFQGADPDLFRKNHLFFKNHTLEKKELWHTHTLSLSYRSTDAVLKMVDTVFEDEEASQGVCESISHGIWRTGHPGCVELWPLLKPLSLEPASSSKNSSPPERIFAQSLAEDIERRILQGEILPSTGKPLTYGDILVLVRRRTRFIDELIYFLKEKGIPVLGRDRLLLKEHLGIQDLLNLAAWTLCPYDDLSLATLLKGPFFEFSEEDLFYLCFKRSGTLFEALKQASFKNLKFQKALEDLNAFHALQKISSAFSFFTLILTRHEGRLILLKRFGEEFHDILDEFLSLLHSLDFKKGYGLSQCVSWIQHSSLEVKRDLESQSSSCVRIMTVHGSKGLEAPFVILPDTTGLPLGIGANSLYIQDKKPLFIPSKEFRPHTLENMMASAYKKDLEEYRRLFYVALTRAQDHLLIAGFLKSSSSFLSPDTWYHLAEKALEKKGAPTPYTFLSKTRNAWSGTGLSFASPSFKKKDLPLRKKVSKDPPAFSCPSWVKSPAPQENSSLKTLFPSQTDSSSQNSFSQETRDYGRALHMLLEKLPAHDRTSWKTVGLFLLKDFPLENFSSEKIVKTALKILKDPHLAFLFGEKSRGEVPVMGKIKGHLVSGRIDRLVLEKDQIWIVDYKSDRTPPKLKNHLSQAYAQQLFLYYELLHPLYPTSSFHLGILWIETGELMEIPLDVLKTLLPPKNQKIPSGR